MNAHNPELVNALVDGELRGARRWLVQRHVSACPICAAEYRRLHHVRQLVADNPPVAPAMSDSPEFFWSKVKREIEREGHEIVETHAEPPVVGQWLRQYTYELVGAAAAAVIALVAFGLLRTPPAGVETVAADGEPAATQVEQVATALPHTVATVLENDDAGTAVIWVSGLPWTQDMTELKTRFANMDI
jgi:anti-sigma factor RsiW